MYMYHSFLIYSLSIHPFSFLIHSWTSRLLPCPGYYKQCYDEHWGTRVSFLSDFLSVYAQQWDCWIIRQFYFQFFKESPHPSLHSYQQCKRVPFCLHSLQNLLFGGFWIAAILTCWPHCGFDLHFSDNE